MLMTIYTNKYVYVVYNFVLYVYNTFKIENWKWYMLYMYCKLNKKFSFLLNLPAIHLVYENKWIWCYVNKTEANLASTNALAARCVRVIHAQCVLQFALLSRTLLRSSSNNEPSDPPYRIIFLFINSMFIDSIHIQWQTTMICWMERLKTNHIYI